MTNLTKCFCLLHTDDECFYVGLGHQGLGARKGQNFAPNNYQPFQCCPTKIQKTTKVPKMSARRIGYDKSDTKQEQKPSNTFKFAEETKKSLSKKSKSDDDDDDDDEPQQPLKVSYKKTHINTKSNNDRPTSQTFTPVTSASKSTKPANTQNKGTKPSVDIKGNKKRAPAKDGKLNVNNGMFDDIVKKYMFW